MARPKKGQEIRAYATVGIRITLELRQQFEALAMEHGRTLTDELRHALDVYANPPDAEGAKSPRTTR